MFKIDDETGDMITRQGDSYSFRVTGIDDSWDVYYSVYNLETYEILFEIHTKPINNITDINVEASDCDKLIVDDCEKSATYGWNIKRCKDNVEDTVIVVGKDVNDINKITVLPKTTEGTLNGQS